MATQRRTCAKLFFFFFFWFALILFLFLLQSAGETVPNSDEKPSQEVDVDANAPVSGNASSNAATASNNASTADETVPIDTMFIAF